MVEIADFNDKDELVQLDPLKRICLIKKSLEKKQCYVYRDGNKIVGFLIYNVNFFEEEFIDLIYIKEEFRNKKIANQLIQSKIKTCQTQKLFTSTNQSNIPAQKLFETNGFIKSGFIEGLDEGDPEIIYRYND